MWHQCASRFGYYPEKLVLYASWRCNVFSRSSRIILCYLCSSVFVFKTLLIFKTQFYLVYLIINSNEETWTIALDNLSKQALVSRFTAKSCYRSTCYNAYTACFYQNMRVCHFTLSRCFAHGKEYKRMLIMVLAASVTNMWRNKYVWRRVVQLFKYLIT